MIEFDSSLTCSIKALAVKHGDQVKPTSRFFSGKLLMFAFICDLGKTSCFLNQNPKEIYAKYQIECISSYHNLTDTDCWSTSVFFIFPCAPESNTPNEKYRGCLFEVFVANDISSIVIEGARTVFFF